MVDFAQDSYEDQGQGDTQAIIGQWADSGPRDSVTRTPGANVAQTNLLTIGTPTIAVAQVHRLTLDTVADDDSYTLTIADYVFAGTTSGTDKTVQRDAFLTQMALNEDFVAEFTAVAQSTDSIDVTAVRPGTAFSVFEAVTGGATAQINTLTVGTPTVAVAQITTFTIDTAAASDAFSITINGVIVAAGTSAGADKTVQRDAIETLLLANAYFTDNFDYADSSTDAFTVTAKVAGEPFDMTETVESTSAYSLAVSTPNVIGTQFQFTMDDKVFQYAAATTNATTERDALLALIEVDADFAELVDFAASSTNLILVNSLVAGTAFTMTYANESPKGAIGTGTVTFTTTTPNVAGSAYSWAQQVANIVGTQFKIIIDGRELLYAAASVVIETERDALLALLLADDVFVAEVDFAASGTTIITITAATAGDPHTVTYQNENGVGVAGAGTVTLVESVANSTGNPITFGLGLAEGSTDDLAVLPSATSFLFAGIAMWKPKLLPNGSTAVQWEEADVMIVGRKGRIWVQAEDIVTKASNVFLRHTLGTTLQLPGRFRSDADTAKADQLDDARWVTSTTAVNQPAQLEINMP